MELMFNVATFSMPADLLIVVSAIVAKEAALNCRLIRLTAGATAINTPTNYITDLSAHANEIGRFGLAYPVPSFANNPNYSPAATICRQLNNFL